MADVSTKIEVKAEFKQDPSTASPAALDSAEQYVEDYDVVMPEPGSQAWLVNVPPAVWTVWNEMYQNAAVGDVIEVGTLCVHDIPTSEPNPLKQKIELVMSDKTTDADSTLADIYNLEMKTNGYNNTAVFSEKEQPGHRAQQYRRNNNNNATKPRPAGIPSKSDRYNGQDGKKHAGGYRTAIPKKTTLAPAIHHEAVATPVQTANYNDLKQAFAAEEAKLGKVVFKPGLYRPPIAGRSTAPLFSLTSKPNRSGKKKVPKEKAVRMDRTLLLDQMQTLFAQFEYWPLRSMRVRLNQPEAYIKEMLESIAVLIKAGDFANTYKLKPEYAGLSRQQPVKQEIAPDVGDPESVSGSEEGEEEFEDVEMKGDS